jgi:hypothetical protein
MDINQGNKVTALYMGWRHWETDRWFPFRKMQWENGVYQTFYLQGLRSAMAVGGFYKGFVKSGLVDLYEVRLSKEIEVSFRVKMPVNRPFTDTIELEQLGLSKDLAEFDPFQYMARRSGIEGRDGCDIFAEVSLSEDGPRRFYFKVMQAKDAMPISSEYMEILGTGTVLEARSYLLYYQNVLLGSLPRYIADILQRHPADVNILVERVNETVHGYRWIFCCAVVSSAVDNPFDGEDFTPLVENLASVH